MSTFLADKERHCCWCGALDASMLCSCRQVSFCDRACAKSAWSAHSLVCTYDDSDNNSKKKRALAPGDIVMVHGLSSAKGQEMNDNLAEVQSFDKVNNRFAVVMSIPRTCKVIGGSVKKENLTLRLSARSAARNARKANFGKVYAGFRMVDLERITPLDLVKGVRSGIPFVVVGMLKHESEFQLSTIRELFENGLADACLQYLQFPLYTDLVNDEAALFAPYDTLAVLIQFFLRLTPDSRDPKADYSPVRGIAVDICRNMGPVILLVSTKKYRFVSATDYWLKLLQRCLWLLHKCFFVGQNEAVEAIRALPRIVVERLLNTLVATLATDPRVFLEISSYAKTTNDQTTSHALTCINNLMRPVEPISIVGPDASMAPVVRMGSVRPPAGVKGLANRTFASSFLHLYTTYFVLLLTNVDQASIDNQAQSGEHWMHLGSCICLSFVAAIAVKKENMQVLELDETTYQAMDEFPRRFSGKSSPPSFPDCMAWCKRYIRSNTL